jgi:hypothetical protein
MMLVRLNLFFLDLAVFGGAGFPEEMRVDRLRIQPN